MLPRVTERGQDGTAGAGPGLAKLLELYGCGPIQLSETKWSDHSHSLACEAELTREGLRIYLILNAYWEPLDFELPLAGKSS